METTKTITEMSASEIEAILKQKKADEIRVQNQRKEAYTKDKEAFLNEVHHRFNEVQGILSALKTEAIVHAENFNKLKYAAWALVGLYLSLFIVFFLSLFFT